VLIYFGLGDFPPAVYARPLTRVAGLPDSLTIGTKLFNRELRKFLPATSGCAGGNVNILRKL